MLLKSKKYHLDLLLLHPTEAKVLILSKNNTYYLPQIEIKKQIDRNDLQKIREEIESLLGISVNVLQYLGDVVHKNQPLTVNIYVLEQQNSREQVQIGVWYDLLTLATLSFTEPKQKSLVEQYLIELETNNIPPLRPPWARSGWFGEVSAWIEEQLENWGYQQTAPIEYGKNWSISCVLRVQTTAGTLYLKEASTLPLFCNEPRVTAELSQLFPQHMPTVLGYKDNWMLLRDFGEPIGNKRSQKVRQDVYSQFAGIQIKSVEHRDFLLQIGCLDRRLEILQSQIEPLVKDENAISDLSSVEIEQLHGLIPHFKHLCDLLASYNIPETLVHGDLHLGNVALNNSDYLFFDWTDACIAHPFFDFLEVFIEGKRKSWFDYLDRFWISRYKKRLRDRYLSQWLEYESEARLLEAWHIAKVLCIVHHAVTYQHIIANLESRTKSEFASFLPFLLREILTNFEVD